MTKRLHKSVAAGDTKNRILDATADFFRRQGYHGTGIKQILATANAPFGSLYHFFPNGKEQLGAEVIHRSGALYRQLFEFIMDRASDVRTGIGDFFLGAAETLRSTDYADACPIAAIALDVASTSEPLRQATADVFESWRDAAAERLVRAGIAPNHARALALSIISTLEGAFVLSRAMKSTEPMEAAKALACQAVAEALLSGRG